MKQRSFVQRLDTLRRDRGVAGGEMDAGAVVAMMRTQEETNGRTETRSQGGNKVADISFRSVGHSQLKELRLSLSESFRVFGITLKRALDPQARRGFSKAYIIALESGKRKITPDIEIAFWRIAAAHDGVDPTTATASALTVYATENIGGALVTGKAVPCARPGCPVKFVKTNPAQKYHSPWCRKQNRQ